jgi:hypothetical protein
VATRELNEIEQFSDLVESIYDAALDATLWSDALKDICRYVQGCGANLFYQGTCTFNAFPSLDSDGSRISRPRKVFVQRPSKRMHRRNKRET